jgi:hypothetical protein
MSLDLHAERAALRGSSLASGSKTTGGSHGSPGVEERPAGRERGGADHDWREVRKRELTPDLVRQGERQAVAAPRQRVGEQLVPERGEDAGDRPGGQRRRAQGGGKPTEDRTAVDHVVEAFSAKYGADRVKEYYPGVDAAVEVPLA